MFIKIREWFTSTFMGEVRVQRPGSMPFDAPLNRKQRRVKMALMRKRTQRRKRDSVSRPTSN